MMEINSRTRHGTDKKMKRLVILLGYLLCIVAFAAGGFWVFRISGKYNLKRQAVSSVAGMENAAQADPVMIGEEKNRQEGRVRYKGRDYCYNSDILAFLFMGIDREKGGTEPEGPGSGQADALFLLVLDPHEKAIKLLPINRNTMTKIDVYDGQGALKDTTQAQICVQYGFGSDGRESCRYQVEAVQKFLYGIPINGYLAVDMDVIPIVTDLVGGIDLTVLGDVKNGQQEVILTKGEQAHLNGEQAYWYVRDRDTSVELSADSRLERQGQFLAGFIDKVKLMTQKDLTAPVKIFNEISGRAETDITADEVAYLATTAGGYHFDAGNILTIPGESVSGEKNGNSKFDEFHADEDALFELVLDLFYEPADE